MKRRNVIMLLCGAVATPALIPLAAHAQQSERVRRLGVLMSTSETDPNARLRIAALEQGLAQLGWTEGRNLKTERRWANGDPTRMRDYAAELVRLAPDLILGTGTPAVAALKVATTTIPIVFTVVNDPVAQGFVASMAQPGGNITGFSFLDYSMVGKSLELLKQIAPATGRIAIIFNPETYPYYSANLPSFEGTARMLSLDLVETQVRSPGDIEEAVARLGMQPGSALLVTPDPFVYVHRPTIIRAAAQYRVPATYSFREHVQEGGLISYGADTTDITRRATAYIDRILRGTKPADLPVQAPVKFEMAINLKTAKALGLDVPPTLIALADEVIE